MIFSFVITSENRRKVFKNYNIDLKNINIMGENDDFFARDVTKSEITDINYVFFLNVCFRGLDYSRPWHDDFIHNRDFIAEKLHLLHPSMQTVLNMCHNTLANLILVDCSLYRYSFSCTYLFSRVYYFLLL